MNGEELKKIAEALEAVGFEAKRIEMERVYGEETYTGALLIRVVRKEAK